ncbi:MAG: DNA polymerase [Candidatus Paceibacteria bacterium]
MKPFLSTIKINFYEFRCVGFRYKKWVFKQKQLQPLSLTLGRGEEYAYTYGAYALKILKELIQAKKVQPVKLAPEVKQQLRRAFVGGRNEFIAEPRRGYNIYSLDYNSMYTTCLATHFLAGAIYYEPTTCLDGPGFYHIRFESLGQAYPVLYTKNALNGQPYFCEGQGEGIY